MLYLYGELRKVIDFKSKKGNELYKLKVELERYDVELFVPSKYYENMEEIKSLIGTKIYFPVYLNTDISEDKLKVYRNFVLAELPNSDLLK